MSTPPEDAVPKRPDPPTVSRAQAREVLASLTVGSPPIPPVEWEQFPLDPSWKGCLYCARDVLGARVGIRPKLAGQEPEGIIVRACSNCGHITTMGPITPAVAAEWQPTPTAPEKPIE